MAKEATECGNDIGDCCAIGEVAYELDVGTPPLK